jgi:hypothetical protein
MPWNKSVILLFVLAAAATCSPQVLRAHIAEALSYRRLSLQS